MIELRHLRKEFEDVTPLEDVNVTINSGDVISGGCAAFTREEMEAFREIMLPAIPNTEIRGMD